MHKFFVLWLLALPLQAGLRECTSATIDLAKKAGSAARNAFEKAGNSKTAQYAKSAATHAGETFEKLRNSKTAERLHAVGSKTGFFWGMKWLGRSLFHLGKSAFYPLFMPFSGAKEAFRSYREGGKDPYYRAAERWWAKDKWHLGIYAILLALKQVTGMSVNQFHWSSDDEFDAKEGGVTVIVDAFREDDIYAGGGKYVFEREYAGKKNVFFVSAHTYEDLMKQLLEISQKHGPIARLDYYGHGLPGRTETRLDPDSYLDRDESTDLHLVSLDGDSIGKNGLFQPLYSMGWEGVFEKDAVLRFNSCFVANGEEGSDWQKAVGNSWLRKGGTVINSRTQILPNFVEMAAFQMDLPKPGRFLRTLGDWVSGVEGLATAYTLLYEMPAHVEGVKGPFLLPSSKVAKYQVPKASDARDTLERAWALNLKKYYSSPPSSLETISDFSPELAKQIQELLVDFSYWTSDTGLKISIRPTYGYSKEETDKITVDPAQFRLERFPDGLVEIWSIDDSSQWKEKEERKSNRDIAADIEAAKKRVQTAYEKEKDRLEKDPSLTQDEKKKRQAELSELRDYYDSMSSLYRQVWWKR